MPFPPIDMSHFDHRNHPLYQCLVVDSKLVKKVPDINEFYRTLGYTESINHTGILEEYFWQTFIGPNARKHFECINYLLITYLYKSSSEFREKFGIEYLRIKGNCSFSKQCPNSPCLNCMNYPSALL